MVTPDGVMQSPGGVIILASAALVFNALWVIQQSKKAS